MIIGYSKNPIYQFFGILSNNRWRILFFTVCALLAHLLHIELGYEEAKLPGMPVTMLGGALAIFLGFRNSSAYDRWWEARKIWGAIVNNSRTLAVQVLTYTDANDGEQAEAKQWQQEFVHRHIGWVHLLNDHLRKNTFDIQENAWLTHEDKKTLEGKTNIPAQILARQGVQIKLAFDKNWIESFRMYELMHSLQSFYDCQGKCERIKNTVFPFYYNYFTQVFLWLFIICLPFALVDIMGWGSVPMSIAISFVFTILEKSGIVTENPFRGVASDTPMSTIARSIEIDLREMLDENEVPEALPVSVGKFGVRFRN